MTLDTLKIINSVWIDICRYTDSKFIPSHNYEQLPPEIIQEHAKIYSKVLKKRKIDLQIQNLLGEYGFEVNNVAREEAPNEFELGNGKLIVLSNNEKKLENSYPKR